MVNMDYSTKGILEIFSSTWLLFAMLPLYVFLGNLLATMITRLYVLSKTNGSWIVRTLGDISWAFPLSVTNFLNYKPF